MAQVKKGHEKTNMHLDNEVLEEHLIMLEQQELAV